MRKKEPEINLHLGCSLQAMREMKDNQYDLAIVDPPYGIGISKDMIISSNPSEDWKNPRGNNYHNKEWDRKTPDKEYFIQLQRVSKKQIIWGIQYYTNILGFSTGRLFWDKGVTMPSLSQGEIALLSFKNSVDLVKILWAGYRKIDNEIRIHPTQKPIELYKWLLENYAKEGDKILDTHLGSGSIACACYDLGFDLDAWEIDKDYYRDTLVRYNNYSKQIKLF